MKAKKILCKYFSVNKDNKTVTVGSVILFGLMYIAIATTMGYSFETIDLLINDPFAVNPPITAIIGIIGLFPWGYVLFGIFRPILTIEITNCNKK